MSIDGILASRHGLYNIDYEPELHSEYQDEANRIYVETMHTLLQNKEDIVLDRAFFDKEDRDIYRAEIEKAGGRWVLVYLKVDKELLWKRIRERRAREINADTCFEISEELLDQYFTGFDVPVGEGEIVITAE